MPNIENNKRPRLTVGELRRRLASCSDNDEIIFGCEELQFNRVKPRGDKLIQIEFNQDFEIDENGKIFVYMND